MKLQRIIGCALVVAAAVVFGMTSKTVILPAAMCAFAAIGALGRITFKLPVRPLFAGLFLAVSFLAVGRMSPFEDPQVIGFILYPVAYSLGQFALVWMAMQFFLRKPDLPATLPLYAVLVFVCAGDVFMKTDQEFYYRLLAMAMMGLSITFFIASRQHCGQARRAGRRIAALMVAAGLSLIGSWVSIGVMKDHNAELNRMFDQIVQFRKNLIDFGFGDSASADFSQDAQLQSVNRLRLARNPTVMLRVFSPSQPGYMRASVYDTYAKSRWRSSAAIWTASPAPSQPPQLAGQGQLFLVSQPPPKYCEKLDIWPSPKLAGPMFVPLGVSAVRAPVHELKVDEHDSLSTPGLAGGVNYQAFVPAQPEGSQTAEQLKALCLRVPEDLDGRIPQLAQKIFSGCDDTPSRIAAVERYFAQNYEYSLKLTVPPGRDPLTYFLINKPGAHCEYFASGAAILLRLGHVPTRYVTGFVANRRNEVGGYWLATSNDAHAWVEAWQEGADGKGGRWVIVEATPPSGLPDSEPPSYAGSLWDSISFELLKMRVAIEVEGFRGFMAWLGDVLAALLKWLVTTIPGLIVLAAAAVFFGRRFWKRRRRIRRHRLPKEVMEMQRLLARADRQIRRHGLSRGASETLHEFAARIRREAPEAIACRQLADWYERYAAVRYGRGVSREDIEQLAAAGA